MEFPVKVNGVEKNPQKNVGKVFQITNWLFWFLCANEAYTDSFFGKIVVKVFLRQHFTIP